MQFAEALERTTGGMIRTGRVSSTNAQRHTAQVQFFEDDGMVTYDLPVLVTRPGDYSLPAVNTPVVCLLPPGAEGVGFVLGAYYTDEDPPPTSDAGARAVAGDDVRLGSANAEGAVALAPAVNEAFQQLREHFQAVESVLTGPTINEPGSGAPSALQIALRAAIAASEYPAPADVGAEKVKAE